MDIDKFMEEQRDAILDHGFTIQYADTPSREFGNLPRAHTVGRTMWQRPELLVVGPFTGEQMHVMISELVHYDDRLGLEVHDLIEVADRQWRIDAAEPSALIGAMAAFGAIRALQCVWANPDGTFPGEPQVVRTRGTHPFHPSSDPYGPADPFKEDE